MVASRIQEISRMIANEELKPFLLHEDRAVREFVAMYFEGCRCRDPELLCLVLQATEDRSERDSSLILAMSHDFVLNAASLPKVLRRLENTDEESVARHLNQILSGIPIDLLEEHETAVFEHPRLSCSARERIERRRSLAAESGEALWDKLQGLTNRWSTKPGEDPGVSRARDIVETLTTRDVPDAAEVCDVLASPEMEGHWLEVFACQLAGAREIPEAVPVLIEKLAADYDDWMMEGANDALIRIGTPEVVSRIEAAFPGKDWAFRLYATGVLENVKRPESVEAILRLLDSERDISIRTCLCGGLCNLLSEKAIPTALREIERGYDTDMVRLEDEVVKVAQILGVPLPQKHNRRRQRDEHQRHAERVVAEFRAQEKKFLEREEAEPRSTVEEEDRQVGSLTPIEREEPKVRRNDPCPCGSGRKYKKCCGKPGVTAPNAGRRASADGKGGGGLAFELKVTLAGIEPPIWRRVLVPGDMTLEDLHRVIQALMDWEGCHLHQLEINGVEYSAPGAQVPGCADESSVRVAELDLEEGSTFEYLYDFGDSWFHIVEVEAVRGDAGGLHGPKLLDGARACPPEDCGGVFGYRRLLQVMQEADLPEHEELLEWMGGHFDPEEFHKEQIEDRLAYLG
jgi:hypothetical protein